MRAALLAALLLSAAPPPAAPPRLGELERLGPPGRRTVVLGVDAPGFEDLTAQERVLAYYLGRAAIAGNAIFTQQSHRHAVELTALLDEIEQHRDALPPPVAAAVREELLRLFIHHGPHDHWQHVKHERWSLTPELLAQAAALAEAHGAHLPKQPEESTAQMLARLGPSLLDPAFEPVHVEQRPGRDVIAGSTSNLYARGITAPMVEGLLGFWQHKINVRFDLRDNTVLLEQYKIGGRYSQELWTVAWWLKKARPHALSGEQANSIQALIDFYTTGDEGLFREHSVHWLRTDTRVDYLNGFIETYLDPRGVVGSFAANVSFQGDSEPVRKLAAAAPYFESRMPFDKRWQREDPTPPVASVMNVLVATGDAGPLTPTAYNLPNDPDLRRQYGSKNVVLLNVELARSEPLRRALIQEFHPPAERDNAVAVGTLARRWMVYLHEVIGHGSGQPDPTVKNLDILTDPALEECRADLVALYHLPDPKLVEVGAFADRAQQDKVVRDAYVSYVTADLAALAQDGDTLRRAQRRANHLVTGYLLEGGPKKRDFGVRRLKSEGKTYITVTDVKKMQQGVAELLAVMQRAASTGDGTAALDLLEKGGTQVDAALRTEVVARAAPLDIPRARALVFPRLVPVVQDGEVVDAYRVHDEDLLTQQRRFQRLARDISVEGTSP